MSTLSRTYRCPMCGYDGFKASAPKAPADVNIQWACPACATARGAAVWLEETSDPRGGVSPSGADEPGETPA